MRWPTVEQRLPRCSLYVCLRGTKMLGKWVKITTQSAHRGRPHIWHPFLPLQVHSPANGTDRTGVNGIKLRCSDMSTITSTVGP